MRLEAIARLSHKKIAGSESFARIPPTVPDTQYTAPPWDLWSALKYHLFPRGALLFAYEAAALAFFAFVSVGTNARVLRLAGTSCIVVSFTQMIVDIFGDGREEIIKHLFLANLAFDVSLILAVAYGGAVVLRRVK